MVARENDIKSLRSHQRKHRGIVWYSLDYPGTCRKSAAKLGYNLVALAYQE
jgi:hypothetical protein